MGLPAGVIGSRGSSASAPTRVPRPGDGTGARGGAASRASRRFRICFIALPWIRWPGCLHAIARLPSRAGPSSLVRRVAVMASPHAEPATEPGEAAPVLPTCLATWVLLPAAWQLQVRERSRVRFGLGVAYTDLHEELDSLAAMAFR